MADKTIGQLDAVSIGDLPSIESLFDLSLIPVEQNGEAKKMTGQQWKQYAVESVQEQAQEAQNAKEAIENLGVKSITLLPGSPATVDKIVNELSGEVTLSFGIPQGVQGPKGDTGNTGDQGPKGDTGDTGVGVMSITYYYLATTASSGVTTSTPGWTTTVQSITSTKRYLWGYQIVNYTNGSNAKTSPAIIGVFGNTGEKGNQGERGNTGPQGPKGDTGATGPQGPKGDTGATGPQGPQGINGVAVAADGQYAFNVDGNGHLILAYTGSEAPNAYINDDGHLILEV